MNELALFAGSGGGIIGGHLLGWRTICAVERDAYAAAVLAQRQNDGILEAFPIWSDVTTFDGKPWAGIVDIISGGFPCQDISVAGKGAGITGQRSGMWKEFLRIICDIQPRFVFVENSPMLTSRGLGVVLGDLASAGYDTEWMCLSAAEIGANHARDRIWILGHSNDYGQITAEVIRSATQGGHDCKTWAQQASQLERPGEQYAELAHAKIMHGNAGTNHHKHRSSIGEQFGKNGSYAPNSNGTQLKRDMFAERIPSQHAYINSADWWKTEPKILRVVDGVAARVDFVNDQLKAIGNGQVPLCAANAFSKLIRRFSGNDNV
jgi:DNA (cytosine-5)-methyltransferase 1